MSKFVIGVDVGGTNIKLGLVNQSGKVTSRTSFSTRAYLHNKPKLIQVLIREISLLLKRTHIPVRNVQGIGIGLPGLINPQKGVVIFLPNIPGWRNVPLQRIIESKFGIRTFLENDVNLITLGEWKFGAGKGSKNLICLTLGTGVGGGLVLNNELYRGEGFVAGEIGHLPLNEEGPVCGCGGYGCFECYIGNRYVLKEASRLFKRKSIDFPDIRRLTRAGHPNAKLFWRQMAVHIGNGLTGIVNILNPTLVIIGGGVSHHNYQYLSQTLRMTVKKRAMKVQAAMAKIVKARLGDDAGIIGARVLVNQQEKKR